MDKALLPAGFHDLLFPDAEKKAHIKALFAVELRKFGYELVEPPVVEFENSLFTGAGKELKNQTFRFMDPISHTMMGARSDMTTQIARIAATRLKKSAKPLRLAYCGDVFRVKGEGLYTERQLTQSGVELVGVDSASADAEVILVIITALQKLGIKGICVDFTMPRLVGIILKDMKYKKDKKEALVDVINKKNIAEIEKLAGKNAPILVKLASRNLTLGELKKIKLPAAAKPLFARLEEVVSIVGISGEDINISINPLESEKFGYHSGIGFTIFAKAAKAEIGRGGRYEIETDGDIISAVGATIYINEILRILPAHKQQDKIFIPFDVSWKDIKKLSSVDDKILIRGIEKVKDNKAEAKKQNCGFIFENGKVVRISDK